MSVEHVVPCSLSVNLGSSIKQIHLNYEGMSEVCPLCGCDEYSLELCPSKVRPAMHLVVNRCNFHNLDPTAVPNASNPVPTKWIKVVPRRRAATRPSFRRFKAGLTIPSPKAGPSSPGNSASPGNNTVIVSEPHSLPPTVNYYEPLLGHENMEDVLHDLPPSHHSLNAGPLHVAVPDPAVPNVSVAASSPPLYEYGSNLALSPSEELEFFEAMGLDATAVEPSINDHGKRRRTDDAMAASPYSDHE